MGLLAVAAALGRHMHEIPTTNNYLESFNSFFKSSYLHFHQNRGIRLRVDHLVVLLITDIIPTILTRRQFQHFEAQQKFNQMRQAFVGSPVRSLEDVSQLIADFDAFGSSNADGPDTDDDYLVLDILSENETDSNHEDFGSDQSVDFDPLLQFCSKSTSTTSSSPLSTPMAAVDAARIFHDGGILAHAVVTNYYNIGSQWESSLSPEIDAELGEAVTAFHKSAQRLHECFNHVPQLNQPCKNSMPNVSRKRTQSDVDLIPLDKEKKQTRKQSYSSMP
jgi:hypothetical protein